ncbi:chitin elicitor receptor kinase 1-like isoform X2 [Phragmites australis]|uniref:chitin elicitor receptor kinase 1-like isoform X2 n=1 Tax=Phragmites australis TaxID=29695 RepID=UPI002D79D74F|nr:chitin elicitor receptor kinase 1-like isoform X2 [Phragmites australis]
MSQTDYIRLHLSMHTLASTAAAVDPVSDHGASPVRPRNVVGPPSPCHVSTSHSLASILPHLSAPRLKPTAECSLVGPTGRPPPRESNSLPPRCRAPRRRRRLPPTPRTSSSPSSSSNGPPLLRLGFCLAVPMAPLRRPLLTRLLLLAAAAWAAAAAGDGCSSGCGLALGSYYISRNQTLTYISGLFGINDYHNLTPYNPAYPNPDFIPAGQRVNVYFPCSCLALPRAPFSTYLAGSLPYNVSTGDTYTSIADHFNNLTTVEWLKATNSYPENNIPNTGTVNVTVNCSCGDAAVSKDYGLFLTYPLRGGETLTSVAANNGFSSTSQMDLLRKYNPGMDGVTGSGIVYIPVKDPSGSYRPLKSPGNGASAGAIAGGVVGVVVALLLGVLLYIIFYRRRKAKKATLLPSSEGSTQLASMDKVTLSTSQADSASPVPGITVDKSVEFSYEELFNATEGFSMSNKIGQGGFGAVYYAELRGEKAAIKKMDMKATNEFLAELKVLTHVHHLNLVRLIGYCIESSLFLVYEYIENGNLSQHLRRTGYEPLSWAARVQIALDSARGLEYIHEHTVPVYIHRDIKSANILIDKNYRAKFEEALNRPDPKEGLQNLIDPVLGEDYPIDSILKVTALARACTQEDPKLRPTMRSVVVALMTLSSTSELWDMNSIQENQGLVSLMSGR